MYDVAMVAKIKAMERENLESYTLDLEKILMQVTAERNKLMERRADAKREANELRTKLRVLQEIYSPGPNILDPDGKIAAEDIKHGRHRVIITCEECGNVQYFGMFDASDRILCIDCKAEVMG